MATAVHYGDNIPGGLLDAPRAREKAGARPIPYLYAISSAVMTPAALFAICRDSGTMAWWKSIVLRSEVIPGNGWVAWLPW
jgi:hypothetical protein